MRRPFLAAALLALAIAAAACAIPTQGEPNTIPSSKVPFNLMDPHPPTTTTTQPPSYVPVQVYFLNSGDQLVPIQRLVAPPAPLIAIIKSLLQGVTNHETTVDNISTAIPSNVSVLSVSTQPGNLVTVNLNSAFGEITGTNTELAVGQIVWTVANQAGANTGVVFEIDGERTSVPIANGSLVSGPVYLLQFWNLPH